ncbi:MAG: NAD(P)/FAD-dependent oxidoreductase [Nitrococcus mobilis]|nr:NAD(P)/FAD-dependent oxidoreductase [Nitrococcus mobilis]
MAAARSATGFTAVDRELKIGSRRNPMSANPSKIANGLIQEGTDPEPVVIIGAGISGLALAWRLERLGIDPLILDAADRFADTWRQRHPQLRLNTHRRFSRLPGRPLSRSVGDFASRETIIEYIESYGRALTSRITFGIDVRRIERTGDAWQLQAGAGEVRARQVVVATGRERLPKIPNWPGIATYRGTLRHAVEFGAVEQYRGKSVLVVGCGNSAVDMLNHLVRVETADLSVAVRNGAAIVPLKLCGVPVPRLSGLMSRLPTRLVDRLLTLTQHLAFGDLSRLGLPEAGIGAATRLARYGVAPAIDDGFVDALKAGRVTPVPGVAGFEHDRVRLTDNRALTPDVVLCATGYSPELENLVGHLDVLDSKGVPRFQGAESRDDVPGLWFLGMKPRLYGTFHAARRDSRALAKRIAVTR